MTVYDGARARALRLRAGIKVDDLAIAAGVSPNTIRSSESGHHQPHPRVAHAVAKALGVTLDELTPLEPPLTLRDIRGRIGLTQTEMAIRLGVVRQMVSQVERGVTGVRSPAAWADAYGLTPTQWESARQAARDLVRRKVAHQAQRNRNAARGNNAWQ
ncbi:helix-turn-helix domain-containing protein [Streptomyces sp. NPDC048297]|uniref:helix-turn-helix domain-containing protein n=1 Tax=Streptomyces sp. NPDC048297 TaxID=3365531 RepID=UPI00371C5589